MRRLIIFQLTPTEIANYVILQVTSSGTSPLSDTLLFSLSLSLFENTTPLSFVPFDEGLRFLLKTRGIFTVVEPSETRTLFKRSTHVNYSRGVERRQVVEEDFEVHQRFAGKERRDSNSFGINVHRGICTADYYCVFCFTFSYDDDDRAY